MAEVEVVQEWSVENHPLVKAMVEAGCCHVTKRLLRVYGELVEVLCSHEPYPINGGRGVDWRWHVSVSAERRPPSWREFVAAVHFTRPGVMFCVPMPPPQFWININPDVLHVFEIKDETLTKAWRAEGARHQRAGRGGGPT